MEGIKELEFGIWQGSLPPPALECLLGSEAEMLRPRDRYRILIQSCVSCSRGDRISLFILEHFLLAHPKAGLYISDIGC